MRNQRALELTLLLASMLTMLANAIIAPSLPLIAEAFKDVKNIEVLTKLMLTLPALTFAFVAPVVGLIIDRYGRLRILAMSLVIYVMAGTSGYWLDSLGLILLGRFFLGIGVAGIMTTATTLVGDYFVGQKRQKFMGIQGAFIALGGLVFITTAGYLADINWRLTFLVYAFATVVLVLMPFTLYEPKTINPKKKPAISENNSSNIVWFVYVSAFLTTLFFYIIPVQLPFLLQGFENISGNQTGLAIGVMTSTQAIATFSYREIKRHFSFSSIYTLGFTIMGIGFMVTGLSVSYGLAIAGVATIGLGIGSLIPNANLWIMSLVLDEQRGKYVGNLSTASFLGMFVSPLAIQPIQNIVGINYSFVIASFILFILAILYFFISKRYFSSIPTRYP